VSIAKANTALQATAKKARRLSAKALSL
jgi:hypothetical protein